MDWIDEIILGLIDRYKTNNVYDLCNCLGIEIIKLDSRNILLANSKAFYYRNIDDLEVIYLRNNLIHEEEEFILKHELGHAILHPELSTQIYKNPFKNLGKYEFQANYFAFRLSNIDFNSIEFENLSLEQISRYIGIPYDVLERII
ncbi:ImmA/IrrE family metallo-endopeptidase [Clostridium sp. YIM B02551]|uniref:ImmA/IrrE family metallo-endopeptidase n=1 Tax=Clostridium sp. YIM B02551 TaxID=2910679 RepID=UPI001EEB3DE8|nr:ImmA/IrrE family metallo-endopeptidase [Clostridium sp. YIM B02551]